MNILVALLKLIHGNLMESQKKMLKIWLNQIAIFALNFVDDHVLWGINFNRHCLINIYIPKKVISAYISCTINPTLINLNKDFALNNRLFGPVKANLECWSR